MNSAVQSREELIEPQMETGPQELVCAKAADASLLDAVCVKCVEIAR